MRRKNKQLSRDEIIEILSKSEYGVLSTISSNGYPYGVPLNYVYYQGSIYFHSAVSGHKIENIDKDPKVSFCVVGNTKLLPAEFNTKYESVIIFGTAKEVFDEEKADALLAIVNKYSKDFIEEGKKYIASAGKKTKVIRIDIVHIEGKAEK